MEYFVGDIHGLEELNAKYIRTLEYVIGKGWHRATAAENCWPLYESALSVEVEPAPAKR